MSSIAPKTQVIYVPARAFRNGKPDPEHPDCEEGFVVSDLGDDKVSCRFYYRNRTQLRTTANSEFCRRADLVIRNHRSQSTIEADWNTYVEGRI